MKVVLQRVSRAEVRVKGETIGKIESGLMLLVGISKSDTEADIAFVAEKCVHLRVFSDADEKMNRSLLDVSGEILAVSQFTLLGNTRKGRRPSFIEAADPDKGKRLYDLFIEKLRSYSVYVACGIFGAMMDVELINHGPVTLMVESK